MLFYIHNIACYKDTGRVKISAFMKLYFAGFLNCILCKKPSSENLKKNCCTAYRTISMFYRTSTGNNLIMTTEIY